MRGPVVRIAFVGALVSSAISLVVLGAASAPLTQEPRPVTQQQRPRKVASPPGTNSAATQPNEKPAPQEVAEGDVVRVDTELVAVPTIVTDRNGKPVTGLRAENFTLF